MIVEDKPITLKDGRTAILKSPCVEDAEKLLNYIKTSCGATEYLARYPEEWNTTVEQEEAWVNRLRSSPDTDVNKRQVHNSTLSGLLFCGRADRNGRNTTVP